jgi:hypothetical protein
MCATATRFLFVLAPSRTDSIGAPRSRSTSTVEATRPSKAARFSATVERPGAPWPPTTVLGRLADIARRENDYSSALEYASLVLRYDAGREDAHRTLMYCYAVLGQRVQAMRQYLLCERLLRDTFDAVPEPATRELYDRLRHHPGCVLEDV